MPPSMGLFDIPTVNRMPEGLICLLLAIFLGPIGIIISGFVIKDSNTWKVGLIQLVVAVVTLGIGAIWSLIHGIIIFVKGT